MKQPIIYDQAGFHQAFANSLQQHKIQLTAAQIVLLEEYYRLLIEGNQKMNLTAITAPDQAAEKHLADSLLLLPYLPKTGLVADMGSGAGLPGLILAAMRPDLSFILIDSLGKRCRFLTETAETLKITNINVRHLRGEQAGRELELRGRCQAVTARAVAPLPILLELTLPLLQPGGCLLAMKGDKGAAELTQSAHALAVLGATAAPIVEYRLRDGEGRSLLQLIQQKPCPPQYPRREGIPERQPL